MKKQSNALTKPKPRTRARAGGSSPARSNRAIAALTRERDQLLEQQTATADLLGIISRSRFELRPVLQTVVDTAVRLCRATSGEIFGLEKGVYHFEVGCNLDPAYVQRQKPLAPGSGTMVGRAAMSRQVVRIDDLLADPTYTLKEEAKIGGARSMVSVPLMREGVPIGVMILARHRVEPFAEREIRLITAFADQAVIAIGVRERETQVARQARSAEQALELLASVSRAANTAIDLRALALDCLTQSGKAAGCQFGQLWCPEPGTDVLKCFANSYFGYPRFVDTHFGQRQARIEEGRSKHPRMGLAEHRKPLWVEDLANRDDFIVVAAARAAGLKSSLALPITIDEDVFVIFELYSTRVLPFDQTVMAAVEKLGRLLGDILERRRSELALRAAHSELARVSQFSALGAMTASIAHEIQQPLAAMVTGANAGLRWLSKSPPELDEVKQVLEAVVRDGHRTSEILDAIRAVFKKDNQEIGPVDVNGLIEEVLELAQGELQTKSVGSQRTRRRAAAGPRQPDSAAAGPAQSHGQCHRRHDCDDRPRAAFVCEIRISRRGKRFDNSGGFRHRYRCGGRRADFRRSFHDQVAGNGNGSFDLPIDCRSAPRAPLGIGRRSSWFGVSCRVAGCRRECRMRIAAAAPAGKWLAAGQALFHALSHDAARLGLGLRAQKGSAKIVCKSVGFTWPL